jgi:hypothetical protein
MDLNDKKLSSKERKKLRTSQFAGSGRSYPIPDIKHARAALSMLHNAPASQQASIKAKVYKKFPELKKNKK